MEFKDQVLSAAVKHFNLPGFCAELLEKAVSDALDKMVADTATPFDNMAKSALYPILVSEINKVIGDQWAKLGEK